MKSEHSLTWRRTKRMHAAALVLDHVRLFILLLFALAIVVAVLVIGGIMLRIDVNGLHADAKLMRQLAILSWIVIISPGFILLAIAIDALRLSEWRRAIVISPKGLLVGAVEMPWNSFKSVRIMSFLGHRFLIVYTGRFGRTTFAIARDVNAAELSTTMCEIQGLMQRRDA